jgi:hypothetical protein
MSRMKQVLFAAVALSGTAWAQESGLARWQTIRAHQPAGVSLQVSAAKSEFYSGELIPLQLSFTSTQHDEFLADSNMQGRVAHMNGEEEFLVDPAVLAEDPLRGLPAEGAFVGGIFGGPIPLSAQPFTFEKLLNEWIHFRKPGKYRIAVLSRRVSQISAPSSSRPELVSNILTLNIVPAPPAWVKQQIGEAVTILNGPVMEDTRVQRLRAGRTLRFLESPEAAIELVRHLGSGDDMDSRSLLMGVLASPYRKQLLPVMEARLVAPDQPVWDQYLDTLARLSQQKRTEYVARLIASLPTKEPESRVISMTTLLDSAGRDGGDTSWLPVTAASLITDFRALPSRIQSNLLVSRWNVIGGPAMLPILREIYALPLEPQVDQGLRDMAVRRIYELAPEEGRRIILSQLALPYQFLSLSTLRMLPDRSLPELNEMLVNRLNAGQFEDSLILRYATGDIVQQVEQAYLKRNADFDRQKLPHCGGPLVYYFLRYDPAFGEKELRGGLDQKGAPPVCYDIGFQFAGLDRTAFSPALERLTIEFLASPQVPIKRGAAEVLGKYGSSAAEKPLWDTLEYFHSWWKGREEQLEKQQNQEGLQFERALRIALAHADGWTLQEEGLHRLLDLCSTNWCRQEVRDWLPQATQPVEIRLISNSDELRASVAQYQTDSEDQMLRKIRQFPADTVFRVLHVQYGDNRLRAQVEQAEQLVRQAGYSLAPQ